MLIHEYYTENHTILCTYAVICLLVLLFYIILLKKNPGTSKKEANLLNLVMNQTDISLLCPLCVVEKTTPQNQYKHCSKCNICIENYDHHCYWINNCIGKNNFIYFLLLVSFLFAFNVYSFCLGFLSKIIFLCFSVLNEKTRNGNFFNIIGIGLLSIETIHFVKKLTCVYILLTTSLYMIPVGYTFFTNFKKLFTSKSRAQKSPESNSISSHETVQVDNLSDEKQNLLKY